MSRDDFEQRVFVAKITAGGSWSDAVTISAMARDWWETTYRDKNRKPARERREPGVNFGGPG